MINGELEWFIFIEIWLKKILRRAQDDKRESTGKCIAGYKNLVSLIFLLISEQGTPIFDFRRLNRSPTKLFRAGRPKNSINSPGAKK
jgi:hypothetical protein